jgi:DNA-binding CsgD family transcriptional regulator
MSYDQNQIIAFTNTFLQQNSSRRTSLTEAQKIVIDTILQGMTYRQAGIEYQYTESSLQNAASGLFKELSKRLGVPVSRQNFIELLEKERLTAQEASSREFMFDQLQTSLWIRQDSAALISISYNATQKLDITSYLAKYSPYFKATFCLEVSSNSSGLDLLWNLCNKLQAALPLPKNDQAALLKSIELALKKHSTLLIFRFDREVSLSTAHRVSVVSEGPNLSKHAEVLTMLALMEHQSCLLILDNDWVSSDAELKRSLAYQLQLMVDRVVCKLKLETPRLIWIENDSKTAHNVLQTYLQRKP